MLATNIYSDTQVLKGDVTFLVNPTSYSVIKGMLNSISISDGVKQRVIDARNLYKYSLKVYESTNWNLKLNE